MKKTTAAALLVALMTLGAPAASSEVLEYDMPTWTSPVVRAPAVDAMTGNQRVLANADLSSVHAAKAAALEGLV